MDCGYTSVGFYSKRTVNIGSVSIEDYLVAEVCCDRMTVCHATVTRALLEHSRIPSSFA